MTATTSKLGADMTYEQINEVWKSANGTCLDRNEFGAMVVDFARALLARQPAAIDKQSATTNSPFSNCKFRECDLPGQCRGEGACHHPMDAAPLANEASKPAPSVVQDERGAFESACDAAYAKQSGNRRTDENDFGAGWECAIEWMQARAASTSANVAQGADAVADPKHDLHARMKIAREAGLTLHIDGKFGSDHYHSVTGSWPAVCRFAWALYNTAAPPAQTALTDDVLMQAIADTAARGHVWASRALSNFRAAVREAAKSPDDA